ncbi:serine protease [Streptomyces lydicus]|uniref:S1 family peptidase n=1 Tax=Streptomyces lydicus TaxID=47763 RepID=UPI003700E6EF
MWTGLIDHSTLYGALRLDAQRYDRASGKTLSSGHGTGFVIRVRELGESRERAEFLVTNRHVVDPGFGPKGSSLKLLGALTVSGHHQPRRYRTLARPTPVKVTVPDPQPIFPKDPDIDLAVMRFDRKDREVVEGNGRFTTFDGTLIAEPWAYEDGHVHPGTQVLAAGYPALGGQCDAERLILVGGVVASDPRYPAEFEGAAFPDSVLCHAFSRAGMSGAPVFAPIQERRWEEDPEAPTVKFRLGIAGVNAGHLEMMGSSDGVISHFVKSTALLEMLADLGSHNADMWVQISRSFARTDWD